MVDGRGVAGAAKMEDGRCLSVDGVWDGAVAGREVVGGGAPGCRILLVAGAGALLSVADGRTRRLPDGADRWLPFLPSGTDAGSTPRYGVGRAPSLVDGGGPIGNAPLVRYAGTITAATANATAARRRR